MTFGHWLCHRDGPAFSLGELAAHASEVTFFSRWQPIEAQLRPGSAEQG